MMKATQKKKCVFSGCISIALIIISFCLFGLSLDRYPRVYMDEAWFNYPAVHYLDHGSLVWKFHPDLPYGDIISAFHGPFYPRLQVLTFKMLGVNQFACRIPQYFAIHIALLLLCIILIRRGFWISAILLPIIWIGDRASQETLYGRMEGITALCVVMAFLCALKAIQEKRYIWIAGYSCFMGLACGFHPGTIYIGIPSFCALLLLWRGIDWRRLFLGLACGVVLPLCLWLICWMPHPFEGMEQFWWYLHALGERDNSRSRFALFPTLKWSKWWIATVMLTTIFWLIPRSVVLLKKIRCSPNEFLCFESIVVLATSFGCGFLLFFLGNTFTYPYYLVSFTVWPVIASLVTLESCKLRLIRRRFLAFFVVIMVTGWCASVAWNGMRFREMLLTYRQLDQTPFVQRVAEIIPKNVTVSGTPELFLVARAANRDFVPLGCGRHLNPPLENWLFLQEKDFSTEHLSKDAIEKRQLVYEGYAFSGMRHLSERMIFRIYGPSLLSGLKPL